MRDSVASKFVVAYMAADDVTDANLHEVKSSAMTSVYRVLQVLLAAVRLLA